MSASAWTPGTSVEVNADTTLKVQEYTATAGQTDFALTNFTYAVGTHSLMVFLNGAMQRIGVDVLEVDPNNFQFVTALHVGDLVSAWGFVGITATVAPEASGAANYYGATAAGTADVLTLTVASYSSYTTGDSIEFIASAANTTTTPTLNVNSISAVTIVDEDGNALVAGAIVAGRLHRVQYDGSNFRLRSQGSYASTLTGYTLTGGSINNTPIGATTANTGAFTTLSTSSTTTLGGAVTVTAGGVNINTFFADATSSQNLLSFTPSDYAASKPYLTIKKSGAASFTFILQDTSTSNIGTLNYTAGSHVFTSGGATTLTLSSGNATLAGNLILSGASAKIQGDFTNATIASRTVFQSSTTNGATYVGAVPNGTSTSASFTVFNAATSTNSAAIGIGISNTETNLNSGKQGTGSYLPLLIYTGGSARLTIDTSGRVGVGVTPSNWAAGTYPIDMSYGAVVATSAHQVSLIQNAYYDGSWKRKQSGYSTYLALVDNATSNFGFYTADTGAADSGIAFVQQVQISHTASAVNYLQLTGAATAGLPSITAAGSDTNIGLKLISKGTGAVGIYTNGGTAQVSITNTTNAVNYLTLTGSAASVSSPIVGVSGSDTNIALGFATKGNGALDFFTNTSTRQIRVTHIASAVNYITLNGNVTTSNPQIGAAGSDTNIGLELVPKGTGSIVISKVDINGGAIDGTPIGASSASTGAFTTLTASSGINSTNIGATTPGTGAFTTLSATGLVTLTGGQIKFPSTQSASSDVNTLDDYEEGTWTPNVGGSATYNTQLGQYVKVGKLVFISGILDINTIGTGSGHTIFGLPFPVAASTYGSIAMYWNTISTGVVTLIGLATGGTSTIELYYATGATTTMSGGSGNMTTNTEIWFSGTYMTTN